MGIVYSGCFECFFGSCFGILDGTAGVRSSNRSFFFRTNIFLFEGVDPVTKVFPIHRGQKSGIVLDAFIKPRGNLLWSHITGGKSLKPLCQFAPLTGRVFNKISFMHGRIKEMPLFQHRCIVRVAHHFISQKPHILLIRPGNAALITRYHSFCSCSSHINYIGLGDVTSESFRLYHQNVINSVLCLFQFLADFFWSRDATLCLDSIKHTLHLMEKSLIGGSPCHRIYLIRGRRPDKMLGNLTFSKSALTCNTFNALCSSSLQRITKSKVNRALFLKVLGEIKSRNHTGSLKLGIHSTQNL